jgi:hypothetical protein
VGVGNGATGAGATGAGAAGAGAAGAGATGAGATGAGAARTEADRMSWARWSLWTGLSGFGAAALTVPATLALGHEIGKHPSNYLAAALPGLLLLLALPPAAVFTTEYLLGRHLKPDRLRFHPAFWTALGVQLVTMVIAIAAGATTHELDRASAFAVADAVILPGTVTLMLYLTRRDRPPVPRVHPAPAPLTGSGLCGGGGRAALLSLAEQRRLAGRHRVQPTGALPVVFPVLRAGF